MLIDIEGREINPKYIVEITKPSQQFIFREVRDGLDMVQKNIATGKFFFTIFIVAVSPLNIICDSQNEAERKREEIMKLIKKFLD